MAWPEFVTATEALPEAPRSAIFDAPPMRAAFSASKLWDSAATAEVKPKNATEEVASRMQNWFTVLFVMTIISSLVQLPAARGEDSRRIGCPPAMLPFVLMDSGDRFRPP
jgi:hypothetical protein